MKTFVFRVVVDTEEDIFRDIEIREDQSFEALHDAIIKAFGFAGDQMASFYLSNEEWEKGQEIGLMDLSQFDGDTSTPSMKNTPIGSVVMEMNQKVLYVYDFLKMWIFYVEVMAINNGAIVDDFPKVILEFGASPDEESKEMPDLFEGIDLGGGSSSPNYKDEYDDDFDDDDPFSEFEDSYDEY